MVNGAQFGHSSGHYFYCKYLSGNFTIRYICYDRGLDRLVLENVDVCYVSFRGSKFQRSLRFLKECIRNSYSIKPDILFVTYFNVCFLLTAFCRYKKTFLDIRTGSLKENSIQRNINNFVILIQSFFFNGVNILSDSLRKKLNISDKNCKVVPLGSEVYFGGNHCFNSLNLLYVGTLDDRNISETIKGLHLFLQNNEVKGIKICYTIIGFGSDAESLRILKSISEYHMSDIVKYIGRKNHNELIPYFEQSNIGIVFVPQTSWYDCQPSTKLFEYMLAGMPVVATNTYENRLIINEDNGVLINDSAKDFCNGLMKIYYQRNSFSSSEIRKSVDSYTWENIVNNNLKPYLLKLLQ
jgi:glycosyltransferase involved in cell wall biosynthesis